MYFENLSQRLSDCHIVTAFAMIVIRIPLNHLSWGLFFFSVS